jgi:hypothetical protein
VKTFFLGVLSTLIVWLWLRGQGSTSAALPPSPETVTAAPALTAVSVSLAEPVSLAVRVTRARAAVQRFLKVFAFVALGLVAAAAITPDGFASLLDLHNAAVLVVASTVGAVLKFVQWQDAGITDAVPSVTLQLPSKTGATS